MGFAYWFRVSMMIVSLVLVVMTIRQLNSAKRGVRPPGFLAALLGSGNSTGVNLCPTRVTRLEAGKVSLFQEGLQWVRVAEEKKDRLNNVAVEKWFSSYCLQSGTKTSASADVSAALKVFFVAGEPQTLLKSASGEYEWMGQPFRSSEMDDALKNLNDLPTVSAQ